MPSFVKHNHEYCKDGDTKTFRVEKKNVEILDWRDEE